MKDRSSDRSMGEKQDPFLVSIHIITDPGQAKTLQKAADQVLSWLHPDLTLFRVSERASGLSRKPKIHPQRVPELPSHQPALAIILFVQDEYGGEESLDRLHGQLRRPPWRYHHTEQVNSKGLLPISPASQDFVSLAPGTPLWALRQVHYGKEIARFTVYCRYETYTEQVRLYRMLLSRKLAQKKEDFCFCVVYCNPETEIQLSFKRMPRGQIPVPTENAVMEIRVRDLGELVPLLPRTCTAISEVRWQTTDYDGNKILLQVQGSRSYHKHKFLHAGPSHRCPLALDPSGLPAPPPWLFYDHAPSSCRNHRNSSSVSLHSQTLPSPRTHSSRVCEQENLPRSGCAGHRTLSMFSLPTDESCTSLSRFRHPSFSSTAAPLFKINVDTLVGAEETDVDTGQTITASSVDLSVVSGYSHPKLRPHLKAQAPRPKSAPMTDEGPDLTELTFNHSFPRRQGHLPPIKQSTSTKPNCFVVNRLKPKTVSGPLPPNRGKKRIDVLVTVHKCAQEGPIEEEHEFFI
ncbi:hypothetical protein DNTS_005422 [Danionella cerebrum]|uniref:FAM124 domain-containing protein n=1 Tax=Danionella cerebrum TaxID=2873325 RepID=A0A553RKM5_9TELE|nr:hypothetical protein DNTS_005422 [Danionella translucida]